ncbi:Arm DNA-binding domain-containing protein [Pseudomonas frederiksbergensis]|uniref:DUF4102 domain-containing protein n=1 Tax=Pseudomonas frederiksbergensis TaxID=104087 RepID=A0AB33EJH6_9PSED|nr:Arm DNA-binding domain-containing protein [Pseudomonas frederiksbergensis]ATE80175.1 hypothetical protein CNN82_28590 [Pseudomonas frederiksbergensis]
MDAELDSKAPAALQLKARPYKTAISQRRYLLTMPTGFKLWRFKLYFERREKALTVGAFPAATRKAERAEHPTLRPRAKGVRLVMTLENSLTTGTPRQILNLTPKQTAAVRAFLLAVETEGTRHAAD